MLQVIARKVGRMPRRQVLLLGSLLVALVSVITFFKGTEAIVGVLFLAPIVLVTWGAGRRAGVVIAVMCALAGLFAEILAGKVYSHPLIATWNGLVDLGTYLVVVLSLDGLRAALRREQLLARRDPLTGIGNRQGFLDGLDFEFTRARRYGHPLTLAYLDLDNFKAVNDSRGHKEGDRVLREVASVLGAAARSVDRVARIGGDEFALLMPETGPVEAARVVRRLTFGIEQRMKRNHWPVTVSGGCATFLRVPEDADDLIEFADALMYQAKTAGKNRLACAVYGNPDDPDGVGGQARAVPSTLPAPQLDDHHHRISIACTSPSSPLLTMTSRRPLASWSHGTRRARRAYSDRPRE